VILTSHTVCVWVGVEWNVSYLENSGEAKEGGSTVDDDAPPEAGGFVAHVFVDNVPGNVLALTGAVVGAEAADTLPAGATATEAAGPSAAADPPLFEHAAGPTVEGHHRTHDNGSNGSQPTTAHNGCPNLPPRMWPPKGRQHMGWHGFQPIVFGKHPTFTRTSLRRHRTRRWWWQTISPTTSFAIKSIPGRRVTGATPPLFHTKVMHKCHGSRALTGCQEWIFSSRVMRDNHGCRYSG
jgi:hypothetical protein